MKYLLTLASLGIFAHCNREPLTTDGLIGLVKGNALIEHIAADGSKKTRPARTNEQVFPGDTIVTGENSTVLFQVTGAAMEVQQNTRFVYERSGDDKQVYLQGGNAWTSVQPLEGNRKFTLRTPNTVAGVRGTKFFTFTDGNNTGTCHCEGKISFKNLATGKDEVNDRDYVMYYRGSKSVKVTAEELRKAGVPVAHNHSEIDNSAVGKKNNLTPAQMQTMQRYVDGRFAALK